MEFWLAAWIMCGITAAVIAGGKNRSVPGWAAIGFLTAIFGVIMVACLPRIEQQRSEAMPPAIGAGDRKSQPRPAPDGGLPEIIIAAAALVVLAALIISALVMALGGV